MKYAAAMLALGATAVYAQGSCSPDLGTNAFTFQTMNVTTSGKRSWDEVHMEKRQSITCGKSVELHLAGGTLNDAIGRQGYVASNDQFQFDGPPQAGYKQTDGFSVCTISGDNQRLALDGSTIFYNCLSGTFNNIYTTKQGEQCYEVYVQVYPCVPASQIPTSPTAVFTNTGPYASYTGGSSISESVSASAPSVTGTEMMVMTAQPMTSTPSALMTPYPVGNSSAPATGSAPPATPVTSPTKAASVSPKASAFTGAANVLAIGQKLVGVVAGAAAYAMI